MGLMSRLHWQTFCEPEPESEYPRMVGQEDLEEEIERQARLTETKEKARVVREKCARAAQSLKIKKANRDH